MSEFGEYLGGSAAAEVAARRRRTAHYLIPPGPGTAPGGGRPSSPGSAPITTPGWSRAVTCHRPMLCSMHSPGPLILTRLAVPPRHLAHPACGLRVGGRQRCGGSTCTVRSMVDSWTDQPAFVLGRRAMSWPPTPLRGRCCRLRRHATPGPEPDEVDPARSGSPRALRRLGPDPPPEMVAILRLDAGAPPRRSRTTELVGELTLKCPEFSQVVVPAQGPRPDLGPQTLPPPRRRAAGNRTTRPCTCPVTRPDPLRVPGARWRHALR